MTTVSSMRSPLAQAAMDEYCDKARLIAPLVSAQLLWRRYLTPQDRTRLGDDLEDAYHRHGTAGMWALLRGVTEQRAILDVAQKIGLLRQGDYEWLLREIGEAVDVDEVIANAIAYGDFVIVESPRAAYWSGEEIAIDWDKQRVPWDFLWELARHGKTGRPIDAFTFGEHAHRDVVTKRKSRLLKFEEFPGALGDAIECIGIGQQKLNLPAATIRIFEADDLERLREWHP